MADRTIPRLGAVVGQGKVVQDARVAEDVSALGLSRTQGSEPREQQRRETTERTILAAVGSLKQIGHAGIPPPALAPSVPWSSLAVVTDESAEAEVGRMTWRMSLQSRWMSGSAKWAV